MYESWHIKREIIEAIEKTNCMEAEKLIIVTKIKEFVISALSVIYGLGILFLIVSVVGLFSSNVERTRNECLIMLLISLPSVIVSILVSESLKRSILDRVNTFLHKKKIKITKDKIGPKFL